MKKYLPILASLILLFAGFGMAFFGLGKLLISLTFVFSMFFGMMYEFIHD